MNEREFYGVILGLQEPWEVKEVKVDAGVQKVEVRVGYREGTLWACPESRERLPVHDHVERSWRHLDTCQFETVLVCRVPRLRLGDGKVWTVPVPWAEKGSRYLWLWHPAELSGQKLEAFEALAYQNLRTARAYYHRIQFTLVLGVRERGGGAVALCPMVSGGPAQPA